MDCRVFPFQGIHKIVGILAYTRTRLMFPLKRLFSLVEINSVRLLRFDSDAWERLLCLHKRTECVSMAMGTSKLRWKHPNGLFPRKRRGKVQVLWSSFIRVIIRVLSVEVLSSILFEVVFQDMICYLIWYVRCRSGRCSRRFSAKSRSILPIWS